MMMMMMMMMMIMTTMTITIAMTTEMNLADQKLRIVFHQHSRQHPCPQKDYHISCEDVSCQPSGPSNDQNGGDHFAECLAWSQSTLHLLSVKGGGPTNQMDQVSIQVAGRVGRFLTWLAMHLPTGRCQLPSSKVPPTSMPDSPEIHSKAMASLGWKASKKFKKIR